MIYSSISIFNFLESIPEPLESHFSHHFGNLFGILQLGHTPYLLILRHNLFEKIALNLYFALRLLLKIYIILREKFLIQN